MKLVPKRVDTPWGYELIWAHTDQYVGKILHVNPGEALSLQYHEVGLYLSRIPVLVKGNILHVSKTA